MNNIVFVREDLRTAGGLGLLPAPGGLRRPHGKIRKICIINTNDTINNIHHIIDISNISNISNDNDKDSNTIKRSVDTDAECHVTVLPTPSPPMKSLDFRGFDSSRLLILRVGNSHVR